MRDLETYIALNRFGLGMNADDIANTGGSPRDWIKAQINSKFLTPEALTSMPSAANVMRDYYSMRYATKAGSDKRRQANQLRKKDFNAAAMARMMYKVTTPSPVSERFTQFWANHFTVSRTRGQIGYAIPAYETEAIRPHIFSKFENLLIAAVTHPVMLIYLDNIQSIGPNSKRGRKREKDLNENLAREVLELHTLGVNGGYSQEDIIEFAKILTGWSVRKFRNGRDPNGGQQTKRGEVSFTYANHEPGPKTVLGRTYPGDGPKDLVKALRAIAVHPSTAKHIAGKLARHFISDTPDPADIDALADVYMKTGGDLGKVSLALVDLDSVWAQPMPKLKQPEDLVLAVLRADPSNKKITRKIRQAKLDQSLKAMGQDLFRAPSPAGWPEETDRWLSPESLVHRIEWVRAYASKMSPTVNPDDLFEATIATVADAATKRTIRGAPSREDAIALIFSSSAFQRR